MYVLIMYCGFVFVFYMFFLCVFLGFRFFFFKQKTAYEMRISDWSSDVCSSDLMQVTAADGAKSVIAINDATKISASKGLFGLNRSRQIGRASCRERVCQYV